MKRTYRLYFVECDVCGKACDEDGSDFQEAVDAFKMEGGRVYRDQEGDWAHECKDCRQR